MASFPALRGTRAVSTLMIAAFAGVAVWMFGPALDGSGFGDGQGDNAALPPSLRLDGPVQVTSEGGSVNQLVVPLSVRGDEGIDLSRDFDLRAETAMSDSAAAAVPSAYRVDWLSGNGDGMLDPGEQALLTVTLPVPSSVHPDNPLRLVLKPASGSSLVIEDVLN